MAFFTFILFFSLLVFLFSQACSADASESKTSTFIVHTNDFTRPPHLATQDEWYASMHKSVSVSSKSNPDPPNHILYTYKNVFHGFAAKLTAQEAQYITKILGVIGLYKDSIAQLHITRSPGFLGLNTESGPWPDTNMGDGIIIGLVHTGIWPESQCFSDKGLEPVRKEWKGECENGTSFNSSMCNNKLVGSRYFLRGIEAAGLVPPYEERSPRDLDGHGTHTASTAACSQVLDASMLGFAKGTARGMASRAKVAMYKACWVEGCALSDITAAMEKAIEDGVDILSLSIGSDSNLQDPYYSDPIAIGAFAAAVRGIFVACFAGNDGPSPSRVINTAPWITTV